jgi:hypothetical protein
MVLSRPLRWLRSATGFRLYPNPVERGTAMRITVKDILPGYYGLMLFNSAGEKVYISGI